jgi:hypothetical protein
MPILAPTFLFRFAAPLLKYDAAWSAQALQLDDRYRLPSFGELEDRPVFADLRAGWNAEGLYFSLRVVGKRQPPWCRETRVEDSDGVQLLIDTRDTRNIHRAGRFCHRFVLLPFGAGRRLDEPAARLLPINRARENPKPVSGDALPIRSEVRIDGYLLEAHVPAAALTGYDPAEHPRLGFSYAVADRELGVQTFSIGLGFPFLEDPTLWGTLELRG